MRGLLTADDDRPALVEPATGTAVTHADLVQLVGRRAEEFAHLAGHVTFLGTRPRLRSVVDLLALTQAGSTVAVLDAGSPAARLDAWAAAYAPGAVLGFDARPDTDDGRAPGTPLPESVLLPTSGSTGSAKFVRLSAAGLEANARQIVQATRITPDDRALVHLPLHFSYGLSVLTSHLAAGATAVLSTESALGREFGAHLAQASVTTLPGVPFSLELYCRTALFSRDLPDLRAVTTSGGRVGADLLARLLGDLEPRDIDLWCMYGQTEASGRIAVLPPSEVRQAPGSVGYALPGSAITIVAADDTGAGDVHVSGPGNMLGYAHDHADLGSTRTPIPVLDTGDVGRLDDHGRLWLTGRRQRIAKVYGERVSLDDIEEMLAPFGVVAAVSVDDRVGVVVEGRSTTARELERALGFPPRSIEVLDHDAAPRTASGKIDYARLSRRSIGDDPWGQQT